jgi:L-alanine-DL-glutamate epimerase-like enolase superfamily enzyme
MKWSVETKRLDLQYDWNISRNSSAYKVNVFVTLESEGKHYIGECAPNIRFDETPEKMAEVFQGLDLAMVKNASLEQTLAFLKETILYPSLRFAIETAYLAYYVQKKGQTIPELLSLSPPKAKKRKSS